MAVTSIIGEAGVRIRPITSGFARELQALIDTANQQSQSGVLPLRISAGEVDSAISAVVARAEKGAQFPLVVAGKQAEEQVSTVKAQAAAGAELPLTTSSTAAQEAVTAVVAKAEAGAELPVKASTSAADDAITATRAAAEAPISVPVVALTDAAEAEAGALRGAIESIPIGVSVTLDLDGAKQEWARFQDTIASSNLSSKLDIGGASQGVQQLGGAAGQAGDSFGQLGSILSGLDGQVGGLGNSLRGLTSRAAPLLSKGSLLVGGGLVGGALAFGSILSAGQQRLTTIEDSTAALTVALGSAQKSASLVGDVLKVVKGTPFTLDQFVAGARSLVTFGVEAQKVPGYLTAIGEAAAGSGQGIAAVQTITDVFAQTTAIGKVTLDDVYRLANVGVDSLTILANAFGVTKEEIKGMISDGAVPAEKALGALVDGIQSGSNGVAGKVNALGGSMKKLRETFSGASGGLGAASARLGEAILLPFRDTSVAVINKFTDVLDAVKAPVSNLVKALADAAQGPLKLFFDAISAIPPIFEDLNKAFQSGGLEGLLSKIASFTGPLQGTFQSIFDSIRNIAEKAAPIFKALVDGAQQAATVLGAGLLTVVKTLLQALSKLADFLAENAGLVKVLGAALVTYFAVKTFSGPVNALVDGLQSVKSLFSATTEEVVASTAALEANTAAAAANAAAAETAAALQAQSSAVAGVVNAGAGAVGGAGAAAQSASDAAAAQATLNLFQGTAADTAVSTATESTLNAAREAVQTNKELADAASKAGQEQAAANVLAGSTAQIAAEEARDALDKAGEEGEKVGGRLSNGFSKAKPKISAFFKSLGPELAVAAAVIGFQIGNSLVDSILSAPRQKGAKDAADFIDSLGSSARIEPTPKGETNLVGALDALDKYSKFQAGLEVEKKKIAGSLESGKDFISRAESLVYSLPDSLTPGVKQLFGGTLEEGAKRVAIGEAATTQNNLLNEALAAQGQLVAESTKNWNLLGVALLTNADAVEKLGAKKLTDPAEVAKNTEQVRAALSAALTEQGTSITPEKTAELNNLASVLGQYDLATLQKALNDAGIELSDITEGDAPALIKKLEEAAAASEQAAVAATGLGDEMAKVAKSYQEAAKQAEVFASGLFIQQSSWIATLSTVDQFATSLDGLKYQTDFTAGALSGLISNAQAAAQAAYTQAYAQAQLAGSSDAAGEASRAATDATEQLRGQFISAAEAAGYSSDEANTLATALFGIPGSITVDIAIKANTAELDAAERRLEELKASGEAYITGTSYLSGVGRDAQGRVNTEKEQQDELVRWQNLGKIASEQARKDSEALIASNRQKQEADAARRQQEQDAKQAEQEAKRAADEAKRAAEEEQRRKEEELRKYLEAIKNLERASGTFQSSIENVAKSLQQARDQFIGNLQERVQLGQGASVTRLIKNTEERNKLLTEVQAGVQQLQAQGLSADALRYLGVTGKAEDARAVRRLLRASPEQLAQLSGSIGTLSDTAQRAAYREQGQIIGKEVRAAIEEWAATPGAQQQLSFEQVLQIVTESRGDPAAIAQRVTQGIGGTVKR